MKGPSIRFTSLIGTITMDMRDGGLISCVPDAMKNDCVRELWFFGSRAYVRPESDIDIVSR
jgi:hypothetical protein